MSYEVVQVEIQGHLQIIRFNRPNKKNAISSKMYEEISIALERAAHNDQIVIVALTGVGEYYSSGNDITGSFGGNMEDVVAAASNKFE
ncbi:unnamed protein product, partial [Timema podura]|nr:unnamed protein product [Timema podura]